MGVRMRAHDGGGGGCDGGDGSSGGGGGGGGGNLSSGEGVHLWRELSCGGAMLWLELSCGLEVSCGWEVNDVQRHPKPSATAHQGTRPTCFRIVCVGRLCFHT